MGRALALGGWQGWSRFGVLLKGMSCCVWTRLVFKVMGNRNLPKPTFLVVLNPSRFITCYNQVYNLLWVAGDFRNLDDFRATAPNVCWWDPSALTPPFICCCASGKIVTCFPVRASPRAPSKAKSISICLQAWPGGAFSADAALLWCEGGW